MNEATHQNGRKEKRVSDVSASPAASSLRGSALAISVLLQVCDASAQSLSLQALPPVNLVARHAGLVSEAPSVGEVAGPAPTGRYAANLVYERTEREASQLGQQISALARLLPPNRRNRTPLYRWSPGVASTAYERLLLRAIDQFVRSNPTDVNDLAEFDILPATTLSRLEADFLKKNPLYWFANERDLRSAFRLVLGHELVEAMIAEQVLTETSIRGPFRFYANIELPPLQEFQEDLDICKDYLAVVNFQLRYKILTPVELGNLGANSDDGRAKALAAIKSECEQANKEVNEARRLARALENWVQVDDYKYIEIKGGGFKPEINSKPPERRATEASELSDAWRPYGDEEKKALTAALASGRRELGDATVSIAKDRLALTLVHALRPRAGFFGTYFVVTEQPQLVSYFGKRTVAPSGVAATQDGATEILSYTIPARLSTRNSVPRPPKTLDKHEYDLDGSELAARWALAMADATYWYSVDARTAGVLDVLGAIELEKLHHILYRQRSMTREQIYDQVEERIVLLAARRERLFTNTSHGVLVTPEPATIAQSWIVPGQSFDAGDILASVVPEQTKLASLSYRFASPAALQVGSQWRVALRGEAELPLGESNRAKLHKESANADALLRRLHNAILPKRELVLRVTGAERGLVGSTFTSVIRDTSAPVIEIDDVIDNDETLKAGVPSLQRAGIVLNRFGKHILYLERGILNLEEQYDVVELAPYEIK